MNLGDDPELWRIMPHDIARRVADTHGITDETVVASLAAIIQEERIAARPYVRSCTDSIWANEPGVQERFHSVTLNGCDVTPVCIGFNTSEQWVELLVISGQKDEHHPRMILNRPRNAPLTVRVTGDVQVTMAGAMSYSHVQHQPQR